jgi:hypothetical protein
MSHREKRQRKSLRLVSISSYWIGASDETQWNSDDRAFDRGERYRESISSQRRGALDVPELSARREETATTGSELHHRARRMPPVPGRWRAVQM